MKERKTIKFVTVDDIQPFIEKEVSRYTRGKQVKAPTGTEQSPPQGNLETFIDFPPEDEANNIGFRKKGMRTGIKRSLNRFFKTYFTQKKLFVLVTSLLIFLIAAGALYLTVFKKSGLAPGLQQQTAQPHVSHDISKETDPNANAGQQRQPPVNQKNENSGKKGTMMIPGQCHIYIAYLSPRISMDSGNRKESPTLLCKSYKDFIENINANANNTLLLPIKEAITHWDELQKIKVKIYPNADFRAFSWKLIPKTFVIKTNVFKSLQIGKKLGEKFTFAKDNPFNYISFYYKVKFDEQPEAGKLMKLLKVFNISGAELETFNPGINIEDLRGKIINLPLTEKPPELQGI
jgi:hypothetical protein